MQMLRTRKTQQSRTAREQRRLERHREAQSWLAEARWDAAHWRQAVTR